jgi:hypothetical protein
MTATMFEGFQTLVMHFLAMPVGIKGLEAKKAQLHMPPSVKQEMSNIVVPRLSEMDYKKLAGLESERQFSILEGCHN